MTVKLSRRSALAGAAALATGCARRTRDEQGRVKLRFWYTLGGRNREVLLEIIRRFHASQDEVRVEAVYQGDYFESLAKLRTAIAAKAAPALSHVVAEVVPYLARAQTLEPLDGYPGLKDVPFVPALGQSGAFRAVSFTGRTETAEQIDLQGRCLGELRGVQLLDTLAEIESGAHHAYRV